jgi:hypothetical protein
MRHQELEEALAQAKAALRAHQQMRHPAGACLHDWMNGLGRLMDEVWEAERKLSAARNEEYAEIWEGVPRFRRDRLPRVFLRSRDRITVLAAVGYVPPEFGGKIVGNDLSYTEVSPVARLEFRDARLRWSKPGGLDISRHPLIQRGLDPGRALRVVNSGWKGPGRHHLLVFDQASLEIQGSAEPVEVWAMTVDDASARCDGRLGPGPA